jgi:hypothetical protein
MIDDNESTSIDDFSLDDITFKGKMLSDWIDCFSIDIPNGHITNFEAQKLIADLNNKYHLAYNCFNEILISLSSLEQRFNLQKSVAVKELITALREDGAGRIPAKDVLSEMAISSSEDLKLLHTNVMLFDVIKSFFEHNKIKLEKSMQLVINLSYLISSSDRMHFKSGEPYL